MLAGLAYASPHFTVAFFLGSLILNGYLSQEFHKLSHQKNPPKWVARAQKHDFILSRENHVNGHHRNPWDEHYCLVHGKLNKPLEQIRFWRHLERMIYDTTGATPRSWENKKVMDRAFATGPLLFRKRPVWTDTDSNTPG